jgi:ubiquinone/menaquinone biosynthesis C-methylase UbiE
MTMSLDEAIETLRNDPCHAATVTDSYFDGEPLDAARRFAGSEEFRAVLQLLEDDVQAKTIIDLGAGRGIASYAFAMSGARSVIAIEPDSSPLVGYGAIKRLPAELPIRPVAARGESLPIRSGSVDVVFARQVLHHIPDLSGVMRECARVLTPGGTLLATREHVVDDEAQLREFLRNHPVHSLAGGENAYPLPSYVNAISAYLSEIRVLGPWDSVINAFPAVRSEEELRSYHRTVLERRFGPVGSALARMPLARTLVWRHLRRPIPGRMYTFLARRAVARG